MGCPRTLRHQRARPDSSAERLRLLTSLRDRMIYSRAPRSCVESPSSSFAISPSARRDDAAEAMSNMHNSELYGRVLRCNYAQPMKIKGGEQGFSHQPVWADADQYAHDAAADQDGAEGGVADPMTEAEREAERS